MPETIEPAELDGGFQPDVNLDATGRGDLAELDGGEGDGTEGADPTPPALDPDAIAEKVAKRWEAAQSQTRQAPVEKQYTPEELDTMFNVYKPTKELLTALRDGDEEAALAELSKMHAGQQKQFATLMNYTLEAKLAELRKEINPFVTSATAAQAERAEKEFYGANQDLTKYGKVVKMVFAQMVQSGKRFPDAAAASKAVADEARAILKEMGVSTGKTTLPGQQTTTKMNSLARGGNGGAGQGRQSAASGVAQALRELA